MNRKWLSVLAVIVGIAVAPSASGLDAGFRAGWMRLSDDRTSAFVTGMFLRGSRGHVLQWDGSLYYHTRKIAPGVDIEVVPLQVSAMAHLAGRDALFCPFLLGGAGAYWTRTVGVRNRGAKLELGWHLGAGFDYALSDRLFIEAEARYIWLQLRTRNRTLSDALSDYNHLIGTLGLGFRL